MVLVCGGGRGGRLGPPGRGGGGGRCTRLCLLCLLPVGKEAVLLEQLLHLEAALDGDVGGWGRMGWDGMGWMDEGGGGEVDRCEESVCVAML